MPKTMYDGTKYYIIQKTEKSFCPYCHKTVQLLAPRGGVFFTAFYICFPCSKIFHIGHGEVPEDKWIER